MYIRQIYNMIDWLIDLLLLNVQWTVFKLQDENKFNMKTE
jgi:hypothetical protein